MAVSFVTPIVRTITYTVPGDSDITGESPVSLGDVINSIYSAACSLDSNYQKYITTGSSGNINNVGVILFNTFAYVQAVPYQAKQERTDPDTGDTIYYYNVTALQNYRCTRFYWNNGLGTDIGYFDTFSSITNNPGTEYTITVITLGNTIGEVRVVFGGRIYTLFRYINFDSHSGRNYTGIEGSSRYMFECRESGSDSASNSISISPSWKAASGDTVLAPGLYYFSNNAMGVGYNIRFDGKRLYAGYDDNDRITANSGEAYTITGIGLVTSIFNSIYVLKA